MRQVFTLALITAVCAMMFGMWSGVQIGIGMSSGPGGAQAACEQLRYKIILCERTAP